MNYDLIIKAVKTKVRVPVENSIQSIVVLYVEMIRFQHIFRVMATDLCKWKSIMYINLKLYETIAVSVWLWSLDDEVQETNEIFMGGIKCYIKVDSVEQGFPNFLTRETLFRMQFYGRAPYRSTTIPYPIYYNKCYGGKDGIYCKGM